MWQELIHVLEKIQSGYQKMIELSKKKRTVLVMVDMKGLENIIKEEKLLLEDIHQAELRRQGILKQLAVSEPRIQADTRMTEAISFAPSKAIADRLGKLHQSLSELIAEAQEAGDNNQVLVHGALQAVNYRLNQLGGSAIEPTYGGKGQELVSSSKKFDFKA